MPVYKVGDVVIHTATETRMAVEKVKSDEVYCAWKAGDKFDSRWFPSATVHPVAGTARAAAPPDKKRPPAKKAKAKAKKARPAKSTKKAVAAQGASEPAKDTGS
jgi:hypothetical protein